MLEAGGFVEALKRRGFGLYSGVPCSYLTPLINCVIDSPDARYVGAANEGDAVAVACGAELAGTRSVVLFQNSGLGNAVNPFTSLASTAGLPTLVLTTWRGEPGGAEDEPQHETMGRITRPLFDTMGIPSECLSEDPAALESTLDRAAAHLGAKRSPYALVLSKGIFAPHALETPGAQRRGPAPAPPYWSPIPEPLDPDAVLRAIRSAAGPSSALIATTGFTGRALYQLGDRANQFYLVGSMGCASSLALGVALVRPERRVVVIDGDGAALMRLGALATIGHEAPRNLVHVLLDNGVHDSTGAQATVSPGIDLAAIAAACGYAAVRRVTGLDALERALAAPTEGPLFLHVLTRPRAERKLPRPALTPAQVAQRFSQWLADAR